MVVVRWCGKKKEREGKETSRKGRASEGKRRLKLLSFSAVLPRAFHSRRMGLK
jgi:hypothetical protein